MANTIVLALDRHEISSYEKAVLKTLNDFFTWAFVGEMTIKLLGLGFKEYAKDSFNLFDAVVVILSLVEVTMELSGVEGGGAFSALRAVRLLRVFKLARSWKTFRDLLNKMLKTLNDISTFSVLLLLCIFIFLLLGLEIFAHKIKFDANDNPARGVPGSVSPRENFDNPLMGFISIFIVFIGDDWNSIMYNHYRVMLDEEHGGSKFDAYTAVGYFIVLFITGNLVLMNLFLAILLSNFEGDDGDDEAEGSDGEEEKEETDSEVGAKLTKCQQFKISLKGLCCCKKPVV